MRRAMRTMIERTAGSVLDDALGLATLFVVLFAGLSLPGL